MLYNVLKIKGVNVMKRQLKKMMMVMAVVITVITLSACGKSANESSLKQVKDRGTLVVGMISSNPPYEFHTDNHGKDTLRGSDLKLIKKLASKMGVKYKIKSMDLDGLLPAMQAHKVDMLVTSLSPTPERKQAAKFSNVYYKSTNTLVVRKSDYKKYENNPELFKKATIAVVNSSTQQSMIQKLYPKAHLKMFGKVTDLALAVNNKKADAFSIDVPTSELLLKQNKDLKMTSFRHKDSSVGAAVAMPKDTSKDLVDTVNSVIGANKTNYAKWVLQQTKYVQQ